MTEIGNHNQIIMFGNFWGIRDDHVAEFLNMKATHILSVLNYNFMNFLQSYNIPW